VVVVAAATQPAVVDDGAIRIKAGADKDYVDPQGHLWAKDSGFADGDTVDRGDIKVENTTMPALYTTEHFGMTAWSKAIPNGKYTIKLHFCETFDGVTDAGQRVFTVKIGDKTLKDIDPFKDAGGALKAVVKTVEGVEVTTGTLKIEFVEGTQSPEINGIEIIPVK